MVGLVGSAVAFTALAGAALSGSVEASWLGVLLVGLTTGLFNVAVLALMMIMSVPERVALFMGAWTVSHALADGLATAGGGLLHDFALRVASLEVAYASVFVIEAVRLALCVPLLRKIDVDTFAKDVAGESARRSAAAMGWTVQAGSGSLGAAGPVQPRRSRAIQWGNRARQNDLRLRGGVARGDGSQDSASDERDRQAGWRPRFGVTVD